MGFISKSDVATNDNLSTEHTGFVDAPAEVTSGLTMSLQEGDDVEQENLEFGDIIEYVQGRFQRSKDKRWFDEHRWLECYRNFRGLYGSDVQFTDEEKSQAFIKITKTKVLAAYAQITEVLFSANKFPIGIQATIEPTGIADKVSLDMQKKKSGTSLVTRPELKDLLGPLKEKLEPVREELQIGAGTTPTSFTWEPAKMAAREMEKKIQDQLQEAGADKSLRHVAFEMALLGTGVFKGPFLINKEYPKWSAEGTYSPVIKKMPDCEFVSVWDSYPDPDARNMSEAEYFIQRHKYSKSDLRQLKKRPFFRGESIENAISAGYNWNTEYWEDIIRDDSKQSTIERWEVLEYWGTIDRDMAEEFGLTIPKEYENFDQIQVNIWVCNDKILRFVMNPFTPSRIPYYATPFELNPYSFFGIGVAENMLDTQLIMNGFMRLMIDNAALSSNVVFEVDEGNLSPGQDMKIYPGKVFKRQAGAPGQAIFATKFQNVTQECMMIFDKARQLADESTGMPSFAHGQSGVQSTGRTASGMSMLMSAAAQNIKAVVKNIDDYLLAPLGEALFAFNMQYNFDPKYIGDLAVVAQGTESLMKNEIRSQKLMQLLQMAMNPMSAPYVKIDYVLRELSESLDLDPELTINDPREAAIQAQVLGQMQNAQGGPQQAQGPGGPPSPSDPTQTGNGNIAPGAAPPPGANGFTGNGPPPQQGM